jgi:hypothetical protein
MGSIIRRSKISKKEGRCMYGGGRRHGSVHVIIVMVKIVPKIQEYKDKDKIIHLLLSMLDLSDPCAFT